MPAAVRLHQDDAIPSEQGEEDSLSHQRPKREETPGVSP